jgi:hypothetical protein
VFASGKMFGPTGIPEFLFNTFLIGLVASFFIITVEFSVFRNQPQSPGRIYSFFRVMFLILQLPWFAYSVLVTFAYLVALVLSIGVADYQFYLKFWFSLLACGIVNILFEKLLHPESKYIGQF